MSDDHAGRAGRSSFVLLALIQRCPAVLAMESAREIEGWLAVEIIPTLRSRIPECCYFLATPSPAADGDGGGHW